MFRTLRKMRAAPQVTKWAMVKKLSGLKMRAVLNFPKKRRRPINLE